MREWSSGITEIAPGSMKTFGVDQVEVVETFALQDVVFLLLRGRRPTIEESDLLRGVIASHISHGITGQSTLAVRMAADCRSSFLNALVAGFSAGAGPYHQGGLESTMREIQALARIPTSKLDAHLSDRLQRRDRVMGFGHRYHKGADPRAVALMELAAKHQFEGIHIAVTRRTEAFLFSKKKLPMNIEAAGGAILLDLGFEPEIAHLFIVLGRSPMFAAAYQERLREDTRPFPKIKVFDMGPGDE